jgi:hypothetical protein
LHRGCRKIAKSPTDLSADAGKRLSRIPDFTGFSAFAEPQNLQSPSYSYLQALKMQSNLQQATPQRDGDCMGPIIGLEFIHQVLDVEVNRGL